MITVFALSAVSYGTEKPQVKLTRSQTEDTYHLTYRGDPAAKGGLINVFAYRAAAASEVDGASIADGNFLDGETAVIDAQGSFSVDLHINDDAGAVIYLGGRDTLLPKGSSPDLLSTRILGRATGLKAKAVDYRTIRLTWKDVNGAAQYRILRATSESGLKTAKALAVVSAAKGSAYTDQKADAGTKYYYAVQAYDPDLPGELSAAVTAAAKLNNTTISSLSPGKKSMTIKWKKVTGASGYWIYQSMKKNGGFKCVGKINRGGTVKATVKKLKSGKQYYYRIRAYRTVKGKKVWAAYSPVKNKKVK